MDAAAPGLTVNITELARIKNVSQPAISKRLAKFEASGLVRPIREGREVRVRLAEWDAAARETTDPARLVARQTSASIRGDLPTALDEAIAGVATKDPTYTQELTRKAGYDADLKEIEIRKQKGELVEMTSVREAMTRCAETIVRDIGQISARAEEVAAAVGASGASGAREALKRIERELRATLARAMTLLAGGDDEGEPETA